MRKLSLWSLAAALMLAGFNVAAQTAGTVKLGLIGSVTGPYATWELPTTEGVRMAVAELNARGGFTVAGKKYTFTLVEEDGQSKPEFIVNGLQKILNSGDVNVVMGGVASSGGMPMVSTLSRAKVVYIGAFTSLDTVIGKPGNELMFRVFDADASVSESFVPEVVKQLGVTKIGMLLPNEDAPKAIAKLYEPIFKKYGAETAVVEFFQPGTTDFAPVLRKFQGKGLNGLFIGINDADAESIIRQSLEIGGIPTKFMYRGGSLGPGEKYASKIDGFASQILTRDLQTTSDPKVKDWIARYEAFTKRPIGANSWYGLSMYDAVFMLAQAMTAANSVDDSAKIAAKLKGLQYNGVRNMRFDSDGRVHSDIDVGMVKGGKTYSVPAKSR